MAAMPQTFHRLAPCVAQLALSAIVALYLLYFADHGRQLLAFAYPLDYGEGPLLAQVAQLRAGTPIWKLYGDPMAPPYLIVNYPPLYLLVTAVFATVVPPLLAGRIVSLLATVGCVLALAELARSAIAALARTVATPAAAARQGRRTWLRTFFFSLGAALLLLTVPIVREWSALMRVDMLGVCLGLWGLVALRVATGAQSAPGEPRRAYSRAAAAGLLLLACLLTKPSLIAAPGAALCWLGWLSLRSRGDERRRYLLIAIVTCATLGLGGVVFAGLLQWGSGGWFWLHVVTANANRWEASLARGFWQQQLALRWPLAAAAALALGWAVWQRRAAELALPALYTLFGAVVAAGVGKVGAYSNYFLELYAGLVWMITVGAQLLALQRPRATERPIATTAARTLFSLLLCASMLRYPPLWDPTWLRPAGLVQPSPPRLAIGRYGLWDDAAREADVLTALSRVGSALASDVRTAPAVFTDMPGVAMGSQSRLQAFEARQLFDQGLADEGPLLRELANGAIPLAIIDYLGNWLTPGTIEILQRRYAQDGSVGTFDRYRPVEVGPMQPLDIPFDTAGGALRLSGYGLAPPLAATHEPGDMLTLALEWRRAGAPPADLSVVVGLATPDGTPLLEHERPLLYGVYPPAHWPASEAVQHIQPLELPAELPEGRYALIVGLRASGADLAAAQIIASVAVRSQGGAPEASGYFVPAVFREAWADLGGLERAGVPLTPAVPFAWGRLQCFEYVCLELRDGAVRQRPLGAELYLAETIRGGGCYAGEPLADGLCPAFSDAPERFNELGRPISSELARNGWQVQWTEMARLEQPPTGGPSSLGRLGEESLRLPPGTRYRWP
jgi:hypothetical protein